MKTVQALAAQVITRVLTGRTLDSSLGQAWSRAADLDAQGKALTQELCYGTLRHLGPLRALVRPLLTRPATDPQLEALLWVAVYQLQHSSLAAHAVVSNAVDAAALLKVTSAKGLVNAVLRYYLRNRATLDAQPPATEEARYSHAQWWIDLVRKEYPERWGDILQAGNSRPPLTLRVNRRKCLRDGELRVFALAGIACRAIGTDGIVVEDPRNVLALPGFAEGRVSVQDYGAQLAAPFLGVADGMRVLDACAAPGGKTTHILESVRCDMTALDRDNRRLGKIWENLARLGLSAHTLMADAANLDSWWDGKHFDRVLVDVPCTASGVIRRHPDGKWLRRAGDVAQFAQQQRRLLEALWSVVTPGGRLLYTTCSVFTEENEAPVKSFLGRHRDAIRCALPWPDGLQRMGDGQLLPAGGAGEDNHDGFFYALLEKRGG
ncbi:MAG: 16S rRNA (cytosine(967)-C(5))-methyltransferase RsmB [Betaproteobacteria bacterium]|nr:16S rRNA (cytosine(967)-C(5))-methyltransferase RsmB [Betaproteobacteria bacterium]